MPRRARWIALFALTGFVVMPAVATSAGASPTGDPSTTTTVTSTTVPVTTTTTTYPFPLGLRIGSKGPTVTALQRALIRGTYWLGSPNGVFGTTTEQAVFAVQKVNNLPRTGRVDAATAQAIMSLNHLPLHTTSGNAVEISLSHQVVMIIRNGQLLVTLNTSTGGGYSYSENGVSGVAVTPTGLFHVYYQVNKWDVGPLGGLYRPKYFTGGVALHGAYDVPPYPASHGCARLSIAAMDWIWRTGIVPVGATVKVYK